MATEDSPDGTSFPGMTHLRLSPGQGEGAAPELSTTVSCNAGRWPAG